MRYLGTVPSADVTKYDDSDRIAVDSRQWLSVHLPCEHYFVNPEFSIRDRDYIVVDLTFLGVDIVKTELLGCLSIGDI